MLQLCDKNTLFHFRSGCTWQNVSGLAGLPIISVLHLFYYYYFTQYRTGHGNFANYPQKFKIVEDGTCRECCEEEDTWTIPSKTAENQKN